VAIIVSTDGAEFIINGGAADLPIAPPPPYNDRWVAEVPGYPPIIVRRQGSR